MYPNYNNQFYMQDLQGMRDRIDRQLQQMAQMSQPSINQTFQLNSSQNQVIKRVNSIEEVKNELVITESIFLNEDFNEMYIKSVDGTIKKYKYEPIIELDEKDKKIIELTKSNEKLLKELTELKESNKNNNVKENKKS